MRYAKTDTGPCGTEIGSHVYTGDLHHLAVAKGNARPSGLDVPGSARMLSSKMYGNRFREARESIGWAVHLERRVAAHRDRPDIVDPVRVISVVVSEDHRIDPVDACREKLEPKLGRGVDEKPRTFVSLDESAYSASLVARVA